MVELSAIHPAQGEWARKVARKSTAKRTSVNRLLAGADDSTVEVNLRNRVVLLPGNQYGRYDHFFHFLLGYFLPVAGLLAELRPRVIRDPVVLADCGPLSRHWSALTDFEFDYVSGDDIFSVAQAAALAAAPEGFDRVSPNPRRLREATHSARVMMGVDRMPAAAGTAPRILVVGRSEPHEYYEGHTVGGGGSRRRSIPNLDEIAAALPSLGEVTRVNFEECDLRTQAQLMIDTDVIVLQHGAGMANVVWARPGTSVIEVAPEIKLPNFRGLVASLGLDHRQLVQESSHAMVPVGDVIREVTDAVRTR